MKVVKDTKLEQLSIARNICRAATKGRLTGHEEDPTHTLEHIGKLIESSGNKVQFPDFACNVPVDTNKFAAPLELWNILLKKQVLHESDRAAALKQMYLGVREAIDLYRTEGGQGIVFSECAELRGNLQLDGAFIEEGDAIKFCSLARTPGYFKFTGEAKERLFSGECPIGRKVDSFSIDVSPSRPKVTGGANSAPAGKWRATLKDRLAVSQKVNFQSDSKKISLYIGANREEGNVIKLQKIADESNVSTRAIENTLYVEVASSEVTFFIADRENLLVKSGRLDQIQRTLKTLAGIARLEYFPASEVGRWLIENHKLLIQREIDTSSLPERPYDPDASPQEVFNDTNAPFVFNAQEADRVTAQLAEFTAISLAELELIASKMMLCDSNELLELIRGNSKAVVMHELGAVLVFEIDRVIFVPEDSLRQELAFELAANLKRVAKPDDSRIKIIFEIAASVENNISAVIKAMHSAKPLSELLNSLNFSETKLEVADFDGNHAISEGVDSPSSFPGVEQQKSIFESLRESGGSKVIRYAAVLNVCPENTQARLGELSEMPPRLSVHTLNIGALSEQTWTFVFGPKHLLLIPGQPSDTVQSKFPVLRDYQGQELDSLLTLSCIGAISCEDPARAFLEFILGDGSTFNLPSSCVPWFAFGQTAGSLYKLMENVGPEPVYFSTRDSLIAVHQGRIFLSTENDSTLSLFARKHLKPMSDPNGNLGGILDNHLVPFAKNSLATHGRGELLSSRFEGQKWKKSLKKCGWELLEELDIETFFAKLPLDDLPLAMRMAADYGAFDGTYAPINFIEANAFFYNGKIFVCRCTDRAHENKLEVLQGFVALDEFFPTDRTSYFAETINRMLFHLTMECSNGRERKFNAGLQTLANLKDLSAKGCTYYEYERIKEKWGIDISFLRDLKYCARSLPLAAPNQKQAVLIAPYGIFIFSNLSSRLKPGEIIPLSKAECGNNWSAVQELAQKLEEQFLRGARGGQEAVQAGVALQVGDNARIAAAIRTLEQAGQSIKLKTVQAQLQNTGAPVDKGKIKKALKNLEKK